MSEPRIAGVGVGGFGPFGRGLTGHVYRITDAEAFFLPILAGQGPPAQREGHGSSL